MFVKISAFKIFTALFSWLSLLRSSCVKISFLSTSSFLLLSSSLTTSVFSISLSKCFFKSASLIANSLFSSKTTSTGKTVISGSIPSAWIVLPLDK